MAASRGQCPAAAGGPGSAAHKYLPLGSVAQTPGAAARCCLEPRAVSVPTFRNRLAPPWRPARGHCLPELTFTQFHQTFAGRGPQGGRSSAMGQEGGAGWAAGPCSLSSGRPCRLVEGPSAASPSPVHRSMHLCLNHSAAPQPLLRSGRAQPGPLRSLRSCLARPPKPQGPRKQVVFADTKGLSLTSVHMFEDAVGGDSESCWCPLSGFPRPAPPPAPCAPGPRALGADSGFPEAPADPERVPRAEGGSRGLPAMHRAGAHSGFPEGSVDGTTFDAGDSLEKRPVFAEERLTASASRRQGHEGRRVLRTPSRSASL